MKDQEVVIKVMDTLRKDANQPLVVSVMGQTGVGKSSLINAIFGTNLRTDPVRPCTKEVEKVVIKDKEGKELWFYDLPGIGEAGPVDAQYMEMYRQKLLESDIVIWAIHSDTRSVTFDRAALGQLIDPLLPQQQTLIMSKLAFALTKVDLLTSPPWIYVKSGKTGFFAPGEQKKRLLEQKEQYFQEQILKPYGHLIIAQTFNDVKFAVEYPGISYDEYGVYFKGFMDSTVLADLKQRYPQYTSIFDRLYDNYRVVSCSGRFRFGLYNLVLLVLNRLGTESIGRFKRTISLDTLNNISLEQVKKLSSLVIYDEKRKQVLFDLEKLNM